jgi:hypothetical protein
MTPLDPLRRTLTDRAMDALWACRWVVLIAALAVAVFDLTLTLAPDRHVSAVTVTVEVPGPLVAEIRAVAP